jgi:hypothetical protein
MCGFNGPIAANFLVAEFAELKIKAPTHEWRVAGRMPGAEAPLFSPL